MSFLDGITRKIRNGFDDIGSFVTGQPAHGPSISPAPQQTWHAPMAMPKPQAPNPMAPQNTLTNNPLTRGFQHGWDQVNTLDNSRTWQNPDTKNNFSLLHQASHNGLTNLAGDIAKPLIQSGVAVNQGIGNAERKVAGLPTQNADQFMQSALPSIPNANKAIGYTGTKRQVASDFANTALFAAAPGVESGVKSAFESVAPKFVPKLVTKTIANAGTGAIVGAPMNVTNYTASNQPITIKGLKQAAVQGAQTGALFGGAGTVAPEVLHGLQTTGQFLSDNYPRTVWRGAPVDEKPNFVTGNKKMAQEFANDTNGTLQAYTLRPKDVLDVSRPQHRARIEQLIGTAKTKALLSKTPSGIFSPEDESLARGLASKLGYKGVKFDERSVGMKTPSTIRPNPYSVGITDASALGKPVLHSQDGFVRNPLAGSDAADMRARDQSLPEENIANKDKSTSQSDGAAAQENAAQSLAKTMAQTAAPEESVIERPAATAEQPVSELQTVDNSPLETLPKQAIQRTSTAGELERLSQGQRESSAPSRSYDNNTTEFDPLQYVKEQTEKQTAARKAGQLSGVARLKGVKNDLRAKFVDSFAPIEDKVAQAVKGGAHINPEHNLTYQIDRALRTDMIGGQFIRDHGLDKIIQDVPDTKTLDQYVIAKHAQDLERNGVKTGRNAVHDQKLIEALHSQYEPYAQKLSQYNQKLLDTAADYGLISKQTAAHLKEKYPNYVPMNRIFGDEEMSAFKGNGSGKVSISTQSAVKGIKGSARQIESPLGSIVRKTQDVIDQGERNRAAQTLGSYKDLPGNPFQLREMKSTESVGVKPTISYFEDGKLRRFATTKEVAEAAKSLNKEQLGLIGKIFSYPTRILRLGATGINPAFALRNVTKDVNSAFINSKHPFRSSLANPDVFVNALKAAFSHDSEQYGELVREGAGGTSFAIGRDNLAKNVRAIRAEKNTRSKVMYTVTHPSQLLRAVEDTIGRSEEFGRAMQYYGNKKAFLKEGKTDEQARLMAADAARNNTVNFARAGDYGRVLNSVLPYLNAGIQGSRTLLRNMKERPVQTTSKLVITAFLPTATVTAWNLSDPERKKAYDDIPDYEKEGNLIIVPPHPHQDPTTGRWDVIKIPVSQEVANLNNVVRGGVEIMAGDGKMHPSDILGNLIGTTTSLNAQSGRQIANQLTPQGAKPIVETLTNQNLFTGQNIVPDALKNLPAAQQYDKSTSGTARTVGKVFGISPMQVDNFIRTTTGGLGQNLVNMSDTALAKTGAINPTDVRGKGIIPSITQGFTSAAGSTDGRAYFANLTQTARDMHLAGKDFELLNALTSKEIDANGNPIPTDIRTKLTNAAIRTSYPQILAVETAAAKKTAAEKGTPLDPFYNLTPDQQKTVLTIELRKAVDNNDTIASVMKDQNASWLTPFYKARDGYFQQLNTPQSPKGELSMPTPSNQVVAAMNGAKGLTGKNYADYMDQHPELNDYYAQLDKAVRAQHDYFNEPQYKEYPTPNARVEQLLNASSSLTGAAKSAIFKDPEVSNYLADVAMWQLNQGAAKAQFEGNDYTQKDLKNLYSIGNYDVTKLANGEYAQTAGTLSNGVGLAGSGYSTGGPGGYKIGSAGGKGRGGSNKALYYGIKHAKLKRTYAKKVYISNAKAYGMKAKTKKVYVRRPKLKYGMGEGKVKVTRAKA